MAVSDAYNFREIDGRLSTAGVLDETQLAELAAEGYQTVINLLPEDSPYAIAAERGIVESQGLGYAYIPVDFAAPKDSDYREFVAAMQAAADKKLMVHCAANYRVSAFYAMYAVEHLDWSPGHAWDFIGATWNIEEHPEWEAFVAKNLQKKRPR
jgi:protein tyrosine phosphatase (PTP) superfamily phosphohydrolase (DUF442 family)